MVEINLLIIIRIKHSITILVLKKIHISSVLLNKFKTWIFIYKQLQLLNVWKGLVWALFMLSNKPLMWHAFKCIKFSTYQFNNLMDSNFRFHFYQTHLKSLFIFLEFWFFFSKIDSCLLFVNYYQNYLKTLWKAKAKWTRII